MVGEIFLGKGAWEWWIFFRGGGKKR